MKYATENDVKDLIENLDSVSKYMVEISKIQRDALLSLERLNKRIFELEQEKIKAKTPFWPW